MSETTPQNLVQTPYLLQVLRSSSAFATYEAAKTALDAKLADAKDGELVTASYTADGKVHTMIAIVRREGEGDYSGETGYSYFVDTDKTKEDIASAIAAIVGEDETLTLPALKEAIDALEDKAVVDITKEEDVLTIVKGDATKTTLKLKYASTMPDTLTTPNKVGGLDSGHTVAELKGKTYGQLIDMILFPELNPAVVAPAASLSFKNNNFKANGVYEVGEVAPVAADFNTSLNRGTGKVAGQPNKNRAGALIAANSFIYYGGAVANKTLPTKITLGEMAYNYQAAYEQGDVLVTSYGKTATKDDKNAALANPLPAGTANSGAVKIYGTYPYFCNGANASSSTQESSLPTAVTADTKLALIKWTDTLIGAKFASEAATGVRLVFDFPATKTVTKVDFMNTVSGKWEAFTGYEIVAADNKDVQGVSVAYKRLTTNGNLRGALQLRFTLGNA